MGAIVEVSLNLLISLILVRPLGLIGVAAGTLAAMTFRLGYSVWYLSKAILKRPIWKFLKCLLPNLLLAAGLLKAYSVAGVVEAANIGILFIRAVRVSVIVFPLFIALNFLLQPQLFKKIVKRK